MGKGKKKNRGAGWELVRGRSAEELLPRRVSAAPSEQTISVRVEKRAKGKVVTVATGLLLVEADLKSLAKKLKAACGSGGAFQLCKNDVDGGAIEIQGEHVEKLNELLAAAGFGVR